MGDASSRNGDKPRDEESQRFVPEKSVRELLDVFEKLDGEATTNEVAESLDYTHAGAYKRLNNESEYFDRTEVGNSILWSLHYTRTDFLDALDELGDLSRTEQIAEHVECSEDVAREWLLKLEDGDEIVSKHRGGKSLLWAKLPD